MQKCTGVKNVYVCEDKLFIAIRGNTYYTGKRN